MDAVDAWPALASLALIFRVYERPGTIALLLSGCTAFQPRSSAWPPARSRLGVSTPSDTLQKAKPWLNWGLIASSVIVAEGVAGVGTVAGEVAAAGVAGGAVVEVAVVVEVPPPPPQAVVMTTRESAHTHLKPVKDLNNIGANFFKNGKGPP